MANADWRSFYQPHGFCRQGMLKGASRVCEYQAKRLLRFVEEHSLIKISNFYSTLRTLGKSLGARRGAEVSRGVFLIR